MCVGCTINVKWWVESYDMRILQISLLFTDCEPWSFYQNTPFVTTELVIRWYPNLFAIQMRRIQLILVQWKLRYRPYFLSCVQYYTLYIIFSLFQVRLIDDLLNLWAGSVLCKEIDSKFNIGANNLPYERYGKTNILISSLFVNRLSFFFLFSHPIVLASLYQYKDKS